MSSRAGDIFMLFGVVFLGLFMFVLIYFIDSGVSAKDGETFPALTKEECRELEEVFDKWGVVHSTSNYEYFNKTN